jgi:autotransporter-associated beta strand protein
MNSRSKLAAIAALSVLGVGSPAHALSPYSESLNFYSPAFWTAGTTQYSTMQQWDTQPGSETPTTSDDSPWFAAPPINGTNNLFDNDNQPGGVSIGTPMLNVSGGVNSTPYLISGGTPDAAVPNYGVGATPVDAVYTGTHVIVQLASTVGSEDFNGTVGGQSVNPDSMQILTGGDGGGTVLATETSSAFLRKTLISSVNSGINNPFTGTPVFMENWIYEFFIPNYTGEFRANWSHDFHTVFEAVRIDSALTTGSAFPITPRTLYWDIDGAAVGAGGSTPSGTWDGTTQNFNSKLDGSAGTLTAATADGDIINFSAGSDATGSYSVTLTAPQIVTGIKIEEGSVTLSGSTLTAGAFDVAASSSGVVSSQVLGAATGDSVTKTGAGTLTLAAANPYAGGTLVNGGALVVGHGDALGTGNITIANTASAVAQVGLSKAVSVASVSTTGTGKFDITNNALVIKNSNLATVAAQIVAGYNNGDFLGAGITSSTAANDPNFLTAIGYASNIDAAYTTFEGVSGLDDGDMLVKYTYYGDADLTGSVDLDDFNLFLAGYQDPSNVPQTWIYGDFDYTGSVDLDDFNLFLAAYQANGAPLSALAGLIGDTSLSAADRQLMLSAVAAVPEPAALGLFAFGAMALTARRRRAS